MSDLYEYECALSGVTAEGGLSFDDDQMGDCPPGWVEVTMKRRLFNPKYLALQRLKETMVSQAARQIPENIPEELREAQVSMMMLQVEATFHSIEADTPPYLTYEERVFIAPPESNPDLLEAFNEVREGVGLDPLAADGFLEDGEDEDEGDGAGEGEDEGGSEGAPDELEELE